MIVKSPVRYAGNKYQLLPQIRPHMPSDCSLGVDLFGGSGVVALNMPANNIVYNELNIHTYSYIEALAKQPLAVTLDQIKRCVAHFELSNKNRAGYDRLRVFANKRKHPILFYILSRCSFSNLSRFNEAGEFTVSFGNRCGVDNTKMLVQELEAFYEKFRNAEIHNMHYGQLLRDLKSQDRLTSSTFVYADPPYLASCDIPSYAGWSVESDAKLMRNLDRLSALGVKWMMSNVLAHKGRTNKPLRRWSRKYSVVSINAVYRFSRISEARRPEEVIIKNY